MNLVQLVKYLILDTGGLTGRRCSAQTVDVHLNAAMAWLCRAQDAYPPGGVSLDYSLMRGWSAGYPETTGYIIPTFVQYAIVSGNQEYINRAMRMADWLISIQEKDGSFKGGPWGSGLDSFVFDTGQIVFGLIEAHRLSGQDNYLQGAVRAGNWLVNVQDTEGMWRRFSYHNIPHSYYTRVAWGLAQLGKYTGDHSYSEAACRNIDWALTQQLENGWFKSAGFTESGHRTPFTHTIAYTIEGVLETGDCLHRTDYVKAAMRSAESLLQIGKAGFYHGTYDNSWRSNARYSCLTGSAQIAGIFLRLHEITCDNRYLTAAQEINHYVSRCQETRGASQTRGAISGSYPIWGGYLRYTFPNWAAKFFADALLLEKKVTDLK
jgi:uncharacterized protein YyaL (SSP411 family)